MKDNIGALVLSFCFLEGEIESIVWLDTENKIGRLSIS